MPRTPILFLTTPTSGTGSLLRILNACDDRTNIISAAHQFYESGQIQRLRTFHPDAEEGKIYVWNMPFFWNFDVDVSKYKLLLNFRDPRDLLCNQYHWALQHPRPNKSEEEVQKERERVRSAGIDRYVLTKNNIAPIFSAIKDAYCRANEGMRYVISYAQLCADFDNMLETICDCLEVPVTDEILRRTSGERVENIQENPIFLRSTGKMSGTDFWPGRYRNELQAETITKLNDKYGSVIDFCRSIDRPSLSDHYR